MYGKRLIVSERAFLSRKLPDSALPATRKIRTLTGRHGSLMRAPGAICLVRRQSKVRLFRGGITGKEEIERVTHKKYLYTILARIGLFAPEKDEAGSLYNPSTQVYGSAAPGQSCQSARCS